MTWLDYALPLIKQFEGLRLKAYQDAVGVWTIGYGSTGPDVVPGLQWTQQQADDDLRRRLKDEFNPGVTAAVRVRISPQQRAALVSLAYNIGLAAFRNSTLLRLLNAGDYHGAAEQFAVWRLAGGKVLPGLVKRRAAERDLFIEGMT